MRYYAFLSILNVTWNEASHLTSSSYRPSQSVLMVCSLPFLVDFKIPVEINHKWTKENTLSDTLNHNCIISIMCFTIGSCVCVRGCVCVFCSTLGFIFSKRWLKWHHINIMQNNKSSDKMIFSRKITKIYKSKPLLIKSDLCKIYFSLLQIHNR